MNYPANYNTPQTPAPQPPAPANGLGNAGFVLGIVGTVFSFIPIFGLFITIPVSLTGLGVGLGGVHRVFKDKSTNKALTWIGVGLNLLALVLTIAITAIAVSGS